MAPPLPVVVKGSKLKLSALLLVCAALAALCAWLLALEQGRGTRVAVSCASVVFFSLGAILCVYLMCTKRPIARLDESGVTVRGYKGCPVAWCDIERVWKYEQRASFGYGINKAYYVCMTLRNPKNWRVNQNVAVKVAGAYCRAIGQGDMNVSTMFANIGADEIVAIIESHIGGVRLSDASGSVRGAATSDA